MGPTQLPQPQRNSQAQTATAQSQQEQLLRHRQQLQQSVQEKILESQTPTASMGPRGKDTAGTK